MLIVKTHDAALLIELTDRAARAMRVVEASDAAVLVGIADLASRAMRILDAIHTLFTLRMADRGADALSVAHTFRLVFNRRLDASVIVGACVDEGRLITRVGIGDGQAHRAPRGKEERYDHDKVPKIQSARFHAMMKRHFHTKNKAARILFLAHMRFSATFVHIS